MDYKFYTDNDFELYNPTVDKICNYIIENYKKDGFFAVLDKQPLEGLDWIQCGTFLVGESFVIILEVNRGTNSDDTLRASCDLNIEDVLQAFTEYMNGSFNEKSSSLYRSLNFIDFMSPVHYEKFNEKYSSRESNSSCYVVTATYNDINHPVVSDFRDFRDNYLNKSVLGRLFINFYYHMGPFLAKMIRSSSFLRLITFYIILKPIHKLIKLNK